MKLNYPIRFEYLLVILFVVSHGTTSCNGEASEKNSGEVPVKAVEEVDTVNNKKSEEEVARLLITYHLDSLGTQEQVDSFLTKFSEKQQKIIFALNRMDARRMSLGDKLVIPDTLTGDFMDYSPFPEELVILDSIPKTVLISRRTQGFALYEKGKLLRWGPISSGKESTPTPAGLYYGNHKAKEKVSTVNPKWLLPYYFNFMNFEGVGVHQYSMPGYPASHACVRLRMEDAKFIYDWAEQWELNQNRQKVIRNGTPFMVFGEYDFNAPVPWLDLANDPGSNFLTAAERDTLRNYVLRYHRDERNFSIKEKPEGEQLSIPPKDGIQTIQ